jgi:hypothetical protein
MANAVASIAARAAVAVRPFRDAFEHLQTELERMAVLLHAEVLRMRAARILNEDNFRGLYIADEQVDAILYVSASNDHSECSSRSEPAEMGFLSARLAELDREIAARAALGPPLPLHRLAKLFSLSRIELDILLLAIAPDLDPRFETLFSYVQNDVTRKRATVGLMLRLLSPSSEHLRLHSLFLAGSRLLRAQLVRFSEEAQERELPFLARPVRPEERIVHFLLAQPQLDYRLRQFTVLAQPTRSFVSLHLPPVLGEGLRQAEQSLRRDGGILFLHGLSGAGKRSAAEALSAASGRALIVVDLLKAQAAGAFLPATLALLCREALLSTANLLLAHATDVAIGHEPNGQPIGLFQQEIVEAFTASHLIVFVAGESPWPVLQSSASCPWSIFEFPLPSFHHRKQLWQEAIEAAGSDAPSEGIEILATRLANQFVLTGGQIQAACSGAANRARLRDEIAPALTAADLEAAARAQSSQGLQRCAQKVACAHDWSSLVLPPRTLRQLRDVCAAEKYRSLIYAEWGFDARLTQGNGLNVLFSGSSGTGKTMSAGIVARELGLDLYKIDLSTVVSKYIGETEKQLSLIFREAQTSNAILFFDEADAIFGKRSEVNDARDRYANVEVAYLLQKMEEYEGIVILATNFRKNIDEAFIRRIQYIVEFPFPEALYRERIWRGMMPAKAPLADDIDFAFLGRQFELAGGNIRNAALAAAFLAAEERSEIRMEHCVIATSRELQKMGKLPSRSDFREYYDLTRERT